MSFALWWDDGYRSQDEPSTGMLREVAEGLGCRNLWRMNLHAVLVHFFLGLEPLVTYVALVVGMAAVATC